ncbi:hypothetical protein Q0Z83_024550 [Actinoplanes sichuanensis]|uniref:DUF3618 domain-containing protein n=1 Tax=Actinoplanes sichuanensis TaxID=512349 RepID=A0ABW4A114_9ACTN|nr:DUF3618 domain-containing protein [Actinoplanes sichuanensis]BEL04264.1 hypothetical protein Q0Z83_024550 [Actinoplanes sichuanensis]
MSTPQNDPQQLRSEIAQTRADLGSTVEALAAKTDVKARAKQSAAELAERGREQLAATGDKVAATAEAVKDKIVSGTAPVQQHARTATSKAASAARDPKVRSTAVPVAAVALAAAGVILIVRGSRR